MTVSGLWTIIITTALISPWKGVLMSCTTRIMNVIYEYFCMLWMHQRSCLYKHRQHLLCHTVLKNCPNFLILLEIL